MITSRNQRRIMIVSVLIAAMIAMSALIVAATANPANATVHAVLKKTMAIVKTVLVIQSEDCR